MSSRSKYLLPLLALPSAYAQYSNSTGPPSKSVTWFECPAELGLEIPSECGTYAVPLDYSNEGNGTMIDLSILKVKASKEPVKGSIFVNPGGPGLDAASFLVGFGKHMLVLTGGHFDIIGIDPRGTGVTLPVDCFPTPLERVQYEKYAPFALDESDVSIGHSWATSELYASTCKNNVEYGEFVGTSSTARDIMSVVDALGEDGMLRYFGHSYGTVLGANLAAMFPDRIDKLVVDGVANIYDYTHGGWEYDNLGVGEEALMKYLESCVNAGEEVCSLASKGETAEDIFSVIMDLAEEAKLEPIIMGPNATTDIVDKEQVVMAVDTALRITIGYAPYLSAYLTGVLDRNLTTFRTANEFLLGGGPTPLVDNVLAIRCSDSTYRAESLEDIEGPAEKLLNGSKFFGGIYGPAYVSCSRWQMDSKGRYEGDFQVKTKNPALVIGSPYDARTPFVSAKNLSEALEGSALLQHNGLGHTHLYSPSKCTIAAVANYFDNGTLPEEGTVCEQDFDVFSGKGINESFGIESPSQNETSSA